MESAVIESHVEDETENNPQDTTLPPLPDELISLILTFLPAPPNSHLLAFTKDEALLPNTPQPTPLKSASLVSRSWRLAALPLLFAHPRLFIQYRDDFLASLRPLLAFLSSHNLARVVTSFVLFEDWVSDHEFRPMTLANDFWGALFAVVKPELVLISTPPHVLPYFLELEAHSVDMRLIVGKYGSVVLRLTRNLPPRRISTMMGVLVENEMSVWKLWYTTFGGQRLDILSCQMVVEAELALFNILPL